MPVAALTHAPAKASPDSSRSKLTIGAVNDPLEFEADAIADRVMRGYGAPPATSSASQTIRRKCACEGSGQPCSKCEQEERQSLLRKAVGSDSATHTEAPPIVRDVLRSPGQPLDRSTRSFMESRFGYDLSHVRIHAESRAAASAGAVGADAYTVGRNIVFARDRYAPASAEGKRLLAHELAHVVQQSGTDMGYRAAPSHPRVQRQADSGAEVASGPRSLTQTLDPGALSDSDLAREMGAILSHLREATTSDPKNEQLAATLIRLGQALVARHTGSLPPGVKATVPDVDPGSVSSGDVLRAADRAGATAPILAQALPKPVEPPQPVEPPPVTRPPLRLVPKPPVAEPPVAEPPVAEPPPVVEPPVVGPPVGEPPPVLLPLPILIPLIVIVILLWPSKIARDEDYLPKIPKAPPEPVPGPEPTPPEAAKQRERQPAPTPRPTATPAPDADPDKGKKICDDETYKTLKKGYEDACKNSGGMSCSEAKLGRRQYGLMDCEEALRRLAQQRACLAARELFEETCFKNVDPRHQKVLADHQQGVATCEEAVREKCRKSDDTKNLVS